MLTCAHSVKSFVPSPSKSMPPGPVLPPKFDSQQSGSPSPSLSETILPSKHVARGNCPGPFGPGIESPAASGEKPPATEFEGNPQVKAGNSTAATPLPLAPRRDHTASL